MSEDANHLTELIDACRPHADDLSLPEMQELAAAVQEDAAIGLRLRKSGQIDDLIGRAVREVPIPAGLEERLLAALSRDSARPVRAAEAEATDSCLATEATGHFMVAQSSSVSSWYLSRKVWGSVAACAVTLLAAIFLVREPELRLESQEDVAAQSQQWLANLPAAQWSNAVPPEDQFPLPGQLPIRPYRWWQVAGDAASPRVVCYSISQAQPPTQLLFVCRTSRSRGLVDAPPRIPTEASGWFVGGWQSAASTGVVYVLAVQGGALRYQTLLRGKPTLAVARRTLDKV